MTATDLARPARPASQPEGHEAIVTRGLRRTFGCDVAVAGIDLSVDPGEIIALLGPNGAGKTTTIRLLNGILAPDAGRAEVLGIDPTREGDAVRARTGVLTEHAGLDDRLTTRENLMLVARIRGIPDATASERIDALLEQFGIAPLRDRITHGFSTGQRKRVALARALLSDPEVLFLDEPTSGLDPTATREVTELIGRLAAERGRTIVLCTHVLVEAERLDARMVVLERGAILADGTLAALRGELWADVGARVELGPVEPGVADAAARRCGTVDGVRGCRAEGTTLRVRVTGRAVLPAVVRALGDARIDIYEVAVTTPDLEEVYFEILRRTGARETRP